jgi:SAM-dependent methyltransferase
MQEILSYLSVDRMFRIQQYIDTILRFQDGGDNVQFYSPKFNTVQELFLDYHKLLFLGCGNGEEVKQAIDAGHEAYGVTLNIGNLPYAKENYGIDLIIGDMHSLDLETGSFDGVLAFETFEHAYSPLFFLFECNRLLREDGRLFLSSPRFDHERGTMFNKHIHHVMCPTEIQTKSLLCQSNFQNIQVGNDVRGKEIISYNVGTVAATATKLPRNSTHDYFLDLLY